MTIEPVNQRVYHLTELPENVTPVQPSKAGEYDGSILKWTNGNFPMPPAIGTEIAVPMNNLGKGIVVAYFCDAGFCGVEVKLDERYRPAWDIKQNGKGDRKPAMVFGTEVAPVESRFPYAFRLLGVVYRARTPQDKAAIVRQVRKQDPNAIAESI